MRYLIRADDIKPITLNETDRLSSVLQNIAMILNTAQGSCPFYRDFGLDRGYLHRPINVARNLLISQIKEAVETFEPRAYVEDVRFETVHNQPETLIPIVEVEISE